MTVRLTVLVLVGLGAMVAPAQPPAKGTRPKATPAPVKPPPRARPLVVEETTNAAWRVTLTVDHADRAYADGDLFTCTVTSEQDGYLYLFNVDAAGAVTVLFPNQFQSNNRISANQPVTVPAAGDASFRIRAVAGSAGATELVKALVTKEPLRELSQLDSMTRSAKKAKTYRPPQITLKKFRRLAVECIGGDPNKTGVQDTGVANQNPEQGAVVPPPPPPTQQDLTISVQQDKTKIQQDNPSQYSKKMKEWATGQVEITILPSKVKPDPSQTPPTKPDQTPPPK